MRGLKFMIPIVALSLISASGFSSGRESGGGGGNGAVAEFHFLAQSVLASVRAHEFELHFPVGFSAKALSQTVGAMTAIGTHSKLYIGDVSVTAVNYPVENKVILNFEDWNELNREAKKQLVIHELLGLRFRSILDDSNYSYSSSLLKIFDTFTVESAALAIAQVGERRAAEMKILISRTKEISHTETSLGSFTVTEVAIQTFERDSPDSVRVYRVRSSDFGGVDEAKLDHYEGKAGPGFGPF